MIVVYIHSANNSNKRALQWFKLRNIQIKTRRITRYDPITKRELINIIALTENGFKDILNVKSNIYKQINIDLNHCTTNELLKLIIENPSLLRQPIITDGKKLVIGYSNKDIRCFISKKERSKRRYAYYYSKDNFNEKGK
ncbi:MAG: Spx/MgsR family RNA polymerase-binding regulatory protein [Enterococcus hulanensis]